MFRYNKGKHQFSSVVHDLDLFRAMSAIQSVARSLPGLVDDRDRLAFIFAFWATGNYTFFDTVFRPLFDGESGVSLRYSGRAMLGDRMMIAPWLRKWLRKRRLLKLNERILEFVETARTDDLMNPIFWSSQEAGALTAVGNDDELHIVLKLIIEFVELATKAHAIITAFVETSRGMKLLGVPGNFSDESLTVDKGVALCAELVAMFDENEPIIRSKGLPAVEKTKILIVQIHQTFPGLNIVQQGAARAWI